MRWGWVHSLPWVYSAKSEGRARSPRPTMMPETVGWSARMSWMSRGVAMSPL